VNLDFRVRLALRCASPQYSVSAPKVPRDVSPGGPGIGGWGPTRRTLCSSRAIPR
jgi:hypothetical protein